MDRKIPRLSRVCRYVLWTGMAALAALLVLADQIPAQEGRFRGGGPGGGFRIPSPEESFASLDADGDGRLSSEEISANGFVGRMFRDTDTSNGLSRDQFLGEMQRIRERFSQRGGPGGGPDGGRRRDRGRDGEPREENSEGRSNDSPDSDSGSSPGSDPAVGSQPGSTATVNSPARTNRPRITIDLQDDLRSGDTDGDGQLGLYEWRRFAGHSMREFQQFDQNQDGFVTPREVAALRPDETPTTATVTAAPVPPAGEVPSGPATPPAGASAPATSTAPPDERTVRDADRYFRLLDKNNDGQIVPEEWVVGGRIHTMFSNGGIDVTQPVSAADFSSHYARLSVQ